MFIYIYICTYKDGRREITTKQKRTTRPHIPKHCSSARTSTTNKIATHTAKQITRTNATTKQTKRQTNDQGNKTNTTQ